MTASSARDQGSSPVATPTPPRPGRAPAGRINPSARSAARARGQMRGLPVGCVVLVDAANVALAILIAYQARRGLDMFQEARDVGAILSAAAVPMWAGWMLMLALFGAYAPHAFGAGTTEYKRVLTASLVTAGAIGIFCYLAKFPLSRGLYFISFLAGIPLLLIGRFALRVILHRVRRSGRLAQRLVLVGAPRQIDEVAKVLVRERWLGYSVVGAVTNGGEQDGKTTPDGIPILGNTHETARIVAVSGIDVVLFVGGGVGSAQAMRRAAWALESTGASIMLVPSLTDVSSDRIRVRPAAGLPFVELEGPRAHVATRVLKRSFDVMGSSLLIVLTSPFLAGGAFAVWRHDRGPVLFRQGRVGRDGEVFQCLKLRSMVVDADALVATLSTENKHSDDHVLFKVERDPRITPPGRFIRRFSIDELPQLFNVFRGEMSLVGPRPPLPREVARYDEDARRRLAVRPGMTGLWQVSGRSDLSWEDSVRLDLYYVDNWSVLQDLVILSRTVRAVLGGGGAY